MTRIHICQVFKFDLTVQIFEFQNPMKSECSDFPISEEIEYQPKSQLFMTFINSKSQNSKVGCSFDLK